MRKKQNSSNARDARSSKPADGRKSAAPYSKPRPETESRFSKPSIKKSSFRPANNAPVTDGNKARPRFDKPHFSDGENKSSDFEGKRETGFRDKFSSDKKYPRTDKPRFEKPRDFKPRESSGDSRPERSERPFRKPEGNDRPFRKPEGNERPFRKSEGSERPFRKPEDGERPFRDRPSFRDNSSSGFRSRDDFKPKEGFEKPFNRPNRNNDDVRPPRRDESAQGTEHRREEPREFRRNDDGRPARPRSEKSPVGRDSRNEPGFKKKDFDRPENPEPSDEGVRRRVGKFESAPRYNLESYEKRSGVKKTDYNSEVRLNRYISNAGICSRREADDLIVAGQISVNGKIITEMGYKVMPSDVVKYGKKILNREKLVYILLNKPKDYITTTEDPEERKTVLDLIEGACPERVYPVGRLDRNTTGLLLLTNDGELAVRLTHPSGGIKKIYQAELDRPITTEDFEQLQTGVELEDGFIRPDEAGIVTPDAVVVGLEIHSGKNRVVRRIFEKLGYEVQKLDRTVFAGLNKKDLPRGKWRFLNEKEVIKLKYLL